MVGVPLSARDFANRLTLTRRIKELETQKRKMDKWLSFMPYGAFFRMYADYPTPLSKISKRLANKYEGFIGLTPIRRRATALSRSCLERNGLKKNSIASPASGETI